MRKFSSFLAAVSVSAVVLFAGPSWANQNCHDVHVEATNSAVDPANMFGKFAGTAMVSIDGQAAFPAAVSFMPVEYRITDDGTVHLSNALTFDLGAMGALIVQDNAVLSPTADPYLYTMNSRLDNPVGSGMFSGAIGRFTDHGQFSLATLTLTATADGRICW